LTETVAKDPGRSQNLRVASISAVTGTRRDSGSADPPTSVILPEYAC
jgi:hypothetical protein